MPNQIVSMANIGTIEDKEGVCSCMRLVLCSIFGMQANGQNRWRTQKVFNPIFNETYEYVAENYRYISEQVSHNTPISAYHFEGKGFFGFGRVSMESFFSIWRQTRLHVIHIAGFLEFIFRQTR